MLTEEEALQRLLQDMQPGEEESVGLEAALGRYSATDVFASVPLPGFDNSMMDGYALRAEESRDGRPLRVTSEQAAGRSKDLFCQPGEAVRIFTGAPMPAGADAVLMQEDAQREGEWVRCNEPVEVGENVRFRGADLCLGQKYLSQGDRLTAGRIALLASQGCAEVKVVRQPKVAVFTTGDELVEPNQRGGVLLPGQIYNSNGPMLAAQLGELGFCQVTQTHCRDDLAATTSALRLLLEEKDVVLISGGVSVGDHDYVKAALAELGITPAIWKVKVKPGKPFLYALTSGTNGEKKWILGLPGNPVSSFVCFQLLVRPALLKLAGASQTQPETFPATLAHGLTNDADRPHYIRGLLEGGTFTARGLQQSHALFSLSQSNALLRLAPGQECAKGALVNVLKW